VFTADQLPTLVMGMIRVDQNSIDIENDSLR